jgi:hypothetical protein
MMVVVATFSCGGFGDRLLFQSSILKMRDGGTSRLAHVFIRVAEEPFDFFKRWPVVHLIQLIDGVLAHDRLLSL